MESVKADIVIVGAGIAGCIAALALCKKYRVVVIDKCAQAPEKVGECLPPAAARVLKKLSLLHLLDSPEHLLSHGILSYWGVAQPSMIDNVKNPDGLGWHLSRQYFEQQLRAELSDSEAVCFWPAKLGEVNYTSSQWQLDVVQSERSHKLQSSILIDATGRSHAVVRQLGQKRYQYDKQMALWLTANVRSNKRIALISDESDGWWYSAPISGRTAQSQPRVFSWQACAEVIKAANITCSAQFLDKAKQVRGFAPLIDLIEPQSASLKHMVSANSSRLEHLAGEGWYALGDAGMSFDPLSSQGMFHAMTSAIQLAELLLQYGLTSRHSGKLFQSQMDRVWLRYLEHRALFYGQSLMADQPQVLV
ncbi:NAD(P)/FAD-dependent oxidoreductase [Pseudoalteromonas sp. T1lg65]|uniref:NAD(P)/FAD-dependent oxidoreductase n=1 Tax=Pseudoalteromonas sp. T1lg65 TaxID=2077101 RepID=UPI003F78B3BC